MSRPREHSDLWIRRVCALTVAAVAAYASYQHQREFALHGGTDATGAALWPLSVDGLLLLATIGLLKSRHQTSFRVRAVGWLSFLLGIAVSLAANIASAPTLTWQAILVAGWPPVALLLAVELLTHQSSSHEDTQTKPTDPTTERDDETPGETQATTCPAEVSLVSRPPAQQVMWEHLVAQQSRGRIPTGAELDRVAGTNGYGSRVLRTWRKQGRIEPVWSDQIHR